MPVTGPADLGKPPAFEKEEDARRDLTVRPNRNLFTHIKTC
jgi:hypothetical protein